VEAGNAHNNMFLANCSIDQLRDWLSALQHGGKRGDRALSQIRAAIDAELPAGAVNSKNSVSSSSSLDSSSAAALMSMKNAGDGEDAELPPIPMLLPPPSNK
jgi:hypothetical protein